MQKKVWCFESPLKVGCIGKKISPILIHVYCYFTFVKSEGMRKKTPEEYEVFIIYKT